MAERSNAVVLKTIEPSRAPGVRIPLSPQAQKALTIVRVFYFPTSAKTCFCQDAGK